MRRVIAITGASGSGKSTLARALAAWAGDNVTTTVLNLDAYYRDLSHLSFSERDQLDFDKPDAIEFSLFEQHIAGLRAGEPIEAPVYDFESHTRSSQTQPVESADLVILEGLLLGAWQALPAHVDATVWVETALDVCLQRRIDRDVHERGRTESSVRDFWDTRALPAFLCWCDGARELANFEVSGEIDVTDARDAVIRFLNQTS